MKTVKIEGWRFAYHSFALVNQWQILSLLARGDLQLSMADMPFFMPRWRTVRGVFDEAEEQLIAALPAPPADGAPDATFRIYTPYDLSVAPHGKTVVFATSEFQMISRSVVQFPVSLNAMRRSERFSIVTPSQWSRKGFGLLGLREDQVHVVPHGVAVEVFHPEPERREATRRALGLSGFVFGNFSAMSGNKGIDVLLRAFAKVVERAPDARLLLKGTDEVYASTAKFQEEMAAMPATVRDAVRGRIAYTGKAVSNRGVADLYRALDGYVSPYRAEGFNLPTLEAAACGVPVIATRGGPTDEFLTPAFARFIDSEVRSDPKLGVANAYLEPDVEHLTELMLQMIDDHSWRSAAALAGPAHVRAGYTWKHVTDRLVAAAF